jgi:hypothetical protein
MTIKLSEAEYDIIAQIAALRTKSARAANVRDMKMGPQSGIQIDFDGVMTEYAFCKHENIFPDIVAGARSGSYDCFWRGAKTDIKSTRYKTGMLLGTMKKNPDVEVYILSIIHKDETIEFVGWATQDELYRDENIKDLGRGKSYALPQSKLNKF